MDNDDQLEFECESTSSSNAIIIKTTDQNSSSGQYNPILSAYLPLISNQDIYDFDLNTLEEKPWLKPGADIEDYFNYGFDEMSWRMYCAKQRVLRSENLKSVRLAVDQIKTDRKMHENTIDKANNRYSRNFDDRRGHSDNNRKRYRNDTDDRQYNTRKNDDFYNERDSRNDDRYKNYENDRRKRDDNRRNYRR